MINNHFDLLSKHYTFPNSINEMVSGMKNLEIVNNNLGEIFSGSIGFDKDENLLKTKTIGELYERYSSSFQLKEDLIFGSYENLKKNIIV